MSNLEVLELTDNYVKLKQARVYVLAILELPEEVRNNTPQDVVAKSHGNFLIGFNSFPVVGMVFPYEGSVWRLNHSPLQIPARYHSRTKKHPAIIQPIWCGSYGDIETSIEELIKLNYTARNT